MSNLVKPFRIVCLQCNCHVVAKTKNTSEARAIINKNLERDLELLDSVVAGTGNIKIVVFPEFFLTGWPTMETAKEFIQKACFSIPGEETEKLSEKAKKYGIYIAANLYEYDEQWPGCWFNCSFIIDPNGKVASKYRRTHSLFAVSPYDILDEYLKKHDWRDIFPVVETPYGRVAAFPCGEIMIPEVARAFTLNRAEILLHCMGGGIPNDHSWEYMRRVRAAENNVYLASACTGLFEDAPYGTHISVGGSEIIDYEGRVLTRADGPGESMCNTFVDINSLRHFRTDVAAGKMITRLEPELYRLFYQDVSISAPNQFLNKTPESLMDIMKKAKNGAENLIKKNFLISPGY